MSKHVLFLLLILTLGADLSAEPPEAAIRKTLDDQVTAWNKGDIEGFMEGYLRSDELVFTSGGRVRRGWDITLQKYRERYGNAPDTMGRLEFGDVEIHLLADDAGWVLGQWKLTWAEGTSEGGVFTLVVRKTDSGWKVVHDHTSSSSE